jgi:polysaccharide biosynthesis transport protein
VIGGAAKGLALESRMFFRRKSKDNTATAAPPPRSPIPANPTGEPDFGALGRALWRKKLKIIGFTLIAAAGAYVIVNAITPRFRSEARILLEAKENVFLRAEADKQVDRGSLDPENITSQVQVILSRDLAREVIRKEKLTDNPEFNSAIGAMSLGKTLLGLIGIGRDPSAMTAEERTLEAFYERLSVNAVERSRVITINFSSADPDLAARIANTTAATYLTMQQSAKQQQTREASEWLAGEIANMRTKVADAEAKIEEYRIKANLYAGSNNSSLPSQQLTEINSQISAARGQKADLETRAKQLRDLLHSNKSIEASDVATSETLRRLTEQRVALRAQLAEQSSTLMDQHPRIKELRAQIGELDRQIRGEGERLVRQLENDAKLADDRVVSLTQSLDQVKKLASRTNEQDVQLRALEREGKAQRDLLESYLAKYREAVARDNINAAPAEARVISRASPAIKPDYPKKVPIVLIAAFAAFALSAGFTVTGELLSPGAGYAYSYPPAAYVAAPPLAPVLPRMTETPPSMPVMPLRAAAMAPMPVSSIEQIAAWLRQAGDAGRRVAVAGSGRNVGTTYAAISLARALSAQGNVVLVDLAFNAPNLSVISTDPQAPGIAELMRAQVSFGDIITRDQFSKVHLIATGNVGGDAAGLAGSPMLAGALGALAQSYDFVVVDLGAVSDIAAAVAPLSARAVLVTPDAASPAARSARERLTAAGFADVSLLLGGANAAAA